MPTERRKTIKRLESGHEIVAARNAIGESEDGLGFKGASMIQYCVVADVGLDFVIDQRAFCVAAGTSGRPEATAAGKEEGLTDIDG